MKKPSKVPQYLWDDLISAINTDIETALTGEVSHLMPNPIHPESDYTFSGETQVQINYVLKTVLWGEKNIATFCNICGGRTIANQGLICCIDGDNPYSKVFNTVLNSAEIQNENLQQLKEHLEKIKNIEEFNELTGKKQLEMWVLNLECLGEEVEEYLELLSKKFIFALETLCIMIKKKTDEKGLSTKDKNGKKREKLRRRIKYAVIFILDTIRMVK